MSKVNLRAARINDVREGMLTESSLASTMVGPLEVAPIDTLGVLLGSSRQGMGFVAVTVDGASEQRVAHELRSELGLPFELEQSECLRRSGDFRWGLVPVASVAVGFEVVGALSAGRRQWVPQTDFADARRAWMAVCCPVARMPWPRDLAGR